MAGRIIDHLVLDGRVAGCFYRDGSTGGEVFFASEDEARTYAAREAAALHTYVQDVRPIEPLVKIA